MEQNTSSSLFLRTFEETYVEQFDQTTLKYNAPSRPQHIDEQINAWILDTGYRLTQVTPYATYLVNDVLHTREVLLRYTVVYAVPEEVAANTHLQDLVEARKGKMTVPHVPVFRGDLDNKPDLCMCGVFGVPEGFPLSSEDKALAPLPVLSPDFDITPWKDWFVTKETA